mmetsp:Transcript_110700/g.264002  ORF Transcript_110700/g.264002 Transcript_110700/m.264002 type:complete len:449 (-) Transcript_110700:47-1393(-)
MTLTSLVEEIRSLLSQGKIDTSPLLNCEQDEGETKPVTSPSDDGHELSEVEAVFNLTNTVMGVGVLTVPFAFRLSGYISILLILVTILVTSQTGCYIGSALKLASRSSQARLVPRRGRDFAFLAQLGFGGTGEKVMSFVTSLEIWFALVTYIVMNGVNISAFCHGAVSQRLAASLSCCLAALMVFLPMRIYSYLSVVASAALAVAAISLISAALTMDEWANPYDHLGSPALVQLQNVPRSIGIIVFCFAGHPCFPLVYECMKEPWHWRRSVYFTFFLAFFYYGGLGVFGYLVFGQDLQASVTQNVELLPQARLFRQASFLAFAVKIQFTAPLPLNAIMVALWRPEGQQEWPLGRVLALVALTAVTLVTAVAFSKDVAVVAALTGSLFTMSTSVIFPAAIHLCLAQRYEVANLMSLTYLPHFLILVFGVVMAVAGTYLSLLDLFAGHLA